MTEKDEVHEGARQDQKESGILGDMKYINEITALFQTISTASTTGGNIPDWQNLLTIAKTAYADFTAFKALMDAHMAGIQKIVGADVALLKTQYPELFAMLEAPVHRTAKAIPSYGCESEPSER